MLQKTTRNQPVAFVLVYNVATTLFGNSVATPFGKKSVAFELFYNVATTFFGNVATTFFGNVAITLFGNVATTFFGNVVTTPFGDFDNLFNFDSFSFIYNLQLILNSRYILLTLMSLPT